MTCTTARKLASSATNSTAMPNSVPTSDSAACTGLVLATTPTAPARQAAPAKTKTNSSTLTGAPFGMHAVTDRHVVPNNALCRWLARCARSRVVPVVVLVLAGRVVGGVAARLAPVAEDGVGL